VATVIGGGLWGAGQLAGGEPVQGSPTVTPVVLGAVVRQDGGAEAWVPPTQEAVPEPSSEAVLEPAPEAQPAYSQYTVQFGDTVSSIAEAFSISLDCILWSNPDVIADPSLLRVGEELLIPSVEGIIYRVKPGDTLSSIAASYQIDVESILSFAPNGVTSPDDSIEGMTLVLPGAVPPSLAVQEEIEAAESPAAPASDSTPLP
jgi:LysM repeat protein